MENSVALSTQIHIYWIVLHLIQEFGLSGESIYLGTKKGAVIELRTPLIRSDDKLMKIKKDYMPEAFRIDDLSRTDPVEALRALTGDRCASIAAQLMDSYSKASLQI